MGYRAVASHTARGRVSPWWHGSVSEHSTRRCQPAPRLRHVERQWGALVATGLFRQRGAEAPDGSYTGTCRFRTATPVRCAVRPRRRQIAVHLRQTPATASTCWSVRGPVSRSSARIAFSIAHNAHSAAYTGHRRVLRGYRPNPTQRALEGLPQGRNDVRNG